MQYEQLMSVLDVYLDDTFDAGCFILKLILYTALLHWAFITLRFLLRKKIFVTGCSHASCCHSQSYQCT